MMPVGQGCGWGGKGYRGNEVVVHRGYINTAGDYKCVVYVYNTTVVEIICTS